MEYDVYGSMYDICGDKSEYAMPVDLCVGRVYLYEGKPVYLKSGQYWGTYGLSNYWVWYEILPDAKLGEKHEGYARNDMFKKYEGEYEIRTIRKKGEKDEIRVIINKNENENEVN